MTAGLSLGLAKSGFFTVIFRLVLFGLGIVGDWLIDGGGGMVHFLLRPH